MGINGNGKLGKMTGKGWKKIEKGGVVPSPETEVWLLHCMINR